VTLRLPSIVWIVTAFAGSALAQSPVENSNRSTVAKQSVCSTLKSSETPKETNSVKKTGTKGRILLVDLGEREPRKRENLNSRNSSSSAGTNGAGCR
jgi:hypothetical protein